MSYKRAGLPPIKIGMIKVFEFETGKCIKKEKRFLDIQICLTVRGLQESTANRKESEKTVRKSSMGYNKYCGDVRGRSKLEYLDGQVVRKLLQSRIDNKRSSSCYKTRLCEVNLQTCRLDV